MYPKKTLNEKQTIAILEGAKEGISARALCGKL